MDPPQNVSVVDVASSQESLFDAELQLALEISRIEYQERENKRSAEGGGEAEPSGRRRRTTSEGGKGQKGKKGDKGQTGKGAVVKILPTPEGRLEQLTPSQYMKLKHFCQESFCCCADGTIVHLLGWTAQARHCAHAVAGTMSLKHTTAEEDGHRFLIVQRF